MTKLSARSLCFTSFLASWAIPFLPVVGAPATFDFPIYKNKPSGRQLSGQHAPASTPALPASDAQKQFVVPQGFEVRLFAAEPMVVNPVAMTWDDRGRLWVVELYEYPMGSKPGEKGRDRIKILEDVDADGRADTVKVFADGFNLATGILLANDGVYLGQAPHLLFLQDTNGDDKADKQTVVMTGFGLEDRHELLNGFTWGPDGQMYMTHGVFTFTKAVNPDQPKSEPVVLTAGVARYNTRNGAFEVFAEGTSNPWGVDFDRYGNAFVSACVIDHLFHLAPGGLYSRQAGQAPHPYGYEYLPSIVDHKHHMAAYAGVNIVQGNQWPKEWQGAALHGNIHQNAINIDRLSAKGSSFVASKWNDSGDFLTTKDGWFMPVSTQTGPDGAVWVMDWYDKYPCYQNANADPEGVDREHGRIWRVVWTGGETQRAVPSRPEAAMNLSALPSGDLVKLLAHPNVWQRRMAQRILNGRGLTAFGPRELHVHTPLHEMLRKGDTLDARLSALWTLHGTGLLDDGWLDEVAKDPEPALRAWAARLTGERGYPLGDALKRLATLAEDKDPTVRLAVAVAARQFVSGSLTVNTPAKVPVHEVITGPILSTLFVGYRERTRGESDRTLEFLYWMALEPIVAFDPVHAIGFYKQDGAEREMPFSGNILRKIMRRTSDLRDSTMLSRAVMEFGKIPETASSALIAGLRGLLEGQRGNPVAPIAEAVAVIRKLTSVSDQRVKDLAQQLAVLWGDAESLRASLARMEDMSLPASDRIAVIQSLRTQKTDQARDGMLKVAGSNSPDSVRVEAIRALGQVGNEATGDRLLALWETLSPAARRATAEQLATRESWIIAFLTACKSEKIKRGDVPPTVVRSIATHRAEPVRKLSEETFGRFNQTPDEKLKLIAAKRKVVVEGPVDLSVGHEVARKACFVCHAMHGEGGAVGPDLTGVGRSSLDALLHNVIHPNEIIGVGYENVEVETKDDRHVSGRLTENSAVRVRLLMANGQEEAVAKTEIRSLRVTPNSVMPEGLEQMPDADFRNMIWFILAHPKDGKPLTEERKRELIRGGADHSSIDRGSSADELGSDGEAVALWNPDWIISNGNAAGSAGKLPEFAGRRNVLVTRPLDAGTPASIARAINLPRGHTAYLRTHVTARESGDWELRVRVEGEVIQRQTIRRTAEVWQEVRVDLSAYAGRRIALRLENAAFGNADDYAYWSDVAVVPNSDRQAGVRGSGETR